MHEIGNLRPKKLFAQILQRVRPLATDDVIDRSFRIVGLTDEDEHAVAAQYLLWGEELTRLAGVEVQRFQEKA